ncbi:hypothetical protein D9M72_429150 [compost metagenome]
MCGDLLCKHGHVLPDAFAHRARHIVLVSKVEFGLDHRPRVRETFRPSRIDLRLPAARVFDRQAALHLGLGDDQVGETLDFHKIQLAVLEGAS